jgi:hypothetical protein
MVTAVRTPNTSSHANEASVDASIDAASTGVVSPFYSQAMAG